jgi:phosphate transport system substrate-binding protein
MVTSRDGRNGAERHGAERQGVEKKGVEKRGVEKRGVERIGAARLRVREAEGRAPTRACVDKLRALAEPTRLDVLHELAEGPRRVGQLQRRLGIDQSLLSHHLAALRAAKLVATARNGRAIEYRLARGVAAPGPPAGINLGCCQLTFVAAARALGLAMSWVLLLPLLLSLAGCGERATATTKLTFSGSSTVAPLATELGRAFEALHQDVRVEVQAGGSSRGVADAQAGAVDLGMASRALKPDEIAAGLVGSVIAHDGIALIVHRDQPVAELSADQVRAVWRGEVRDWSVLGAPAGPITVVHKSEGRSTLELFLAHFALKPEEAKPDVVIGDNAQGVKTVAGNRGAIGYVSIGTAEFEMAQGVPIRALPLSGVPATRAAVRDGRFPLQRPLTLITRGAPTGLAAKFLEFARSEAGRTIVEQQAFVAPAATN